MNDEEKKLKAKARKESREKKKAEAKAKAAKDRKSKTKYRLIWANHAEEAEKMIKGLRTTGQEVIAAYSLGPVHYFVVKDP